MSDYSTQHLILSLTTQLQQFPEKLRIFWLGMKNSMQRFDTTHTFETYETLYNNLFRHIQTHMNDNTGIVAAMREFFLKATVANLRNMTQKFHSLLRSCQKYHMLATHTDIDHIGDIADMIQNLRTVCNEVYDSMNALLQASNKSDGIKRLQTNFDRKYLESLTDVSNMIQDDHTEWITRKQLKKRMDLHHTSVSKTHTHRRAHTPTIPTMDDAASSSSDAPSPLTFASASASTSTAAFSPVSVPSSSPSATYRHGQRIMANYKSGGVYYSGTISNVRSNGHYDVTYDDDDKEYNVASRRIRPDIVYDIGQRINGNFQNQGTYYPGVIVGRDPNGTYRIRYDDGDIENDVPVGLIKDGNQAEKNGSAHLTLTSIRNVMEKAIDALWLKLIRKNQEKHHATMRIDKINERAAEVFAQIDQSKRMDDPVSELQYIFEHSALTMDDVKEVYEKLNHEHRRATNIPDFTHKRERQEERVSIDEIESQLQKRPYSHRPP